MTKNNTMIYTKKLAEVDAKLQEIENLLKSLRLDTHDILWNLIEAMKRKK